jgi:ABC-type dipeptide/oligopeptide/nickel transport system permease subunit
MNISRILLISAFLLLIIVLGISFTAPEYLSTAYDEHDNILLWSQPSSTHWLGTDGIGYDVWDFLLKAINTDILLFTIPVILFILFGVGLGITLSFVKGRTNSFFDAAFNLLNSIPLILLLLLILIIIEGFFPGFDTFEKLLLLFSLFAVVSSSKLAIETRGKIDSVKTADFVESTRALGVSRVKILFKHILFYYCSTLIVANVLNFISQLIFVEITLAYLKLGAAGKVISLGFMFTRYFSSINAFTDWNQWQIAIPSLVTIYLITMLTVIANKLEKNV